MYRVKEVEGIFIPQQGNFFIGWKGIDRDENHLWFGERQQMTYCTFNYLESARERIKNYKLKIKIPKIKYHKEK